MHVGNGLEDRLFIQRQLAQLEKLVGKHVEEDLRVGVGIDVAQVGAKYVALELVGVDQVAVVGQRDAVGRVHVEGLRFRGRSAPRGWIAHVADAHGSRQAQHVPLLEYVAHQAVVLALMKLVAIAGGDPRGILATVLQHRQGVVQRLIYAGPTNEADNAAHIVYA